MSEKQAIALVGEPDDVNISIGRWGRHEQWVYNRRYIYFDNGRLSAIQR